MRQGLFGPIDEDRVIISMQVFAFEEGISPINAKSFLCALKRAGVLNSWRNLKPYERHYRAGIKRGLKRPRIVCWVLPQRSFNEPQQSDLAKRSGQLDLFEGFVPPSEQTAPSRSRIDDVNVNRFQSPPRAAGRRGT